MGELFFLVPPPPPRAYPVDGTGIGWDAAGILPFSRGLQDEDDFSLGSPEWKDFAEVIDSISLPRGRINNCLSLVMDVSRSCSARLARPPGGCSSRRYQPWAWTAADPRRSRPTNPTQHPTFSPALPQPCISDNFYSVWTDLNQQVA